MKLFVRFAASTCLALFCSGTNLAADAKKGTTNARDPARPIAELMTAAPRTLPASASAAEAALLMAAANIRHVPVIEHGHLECRRCRGSWELPVDEVAELVATLERSRGFSVDLTHLSILGLCAACRAAAD